MSGALWARSWWAYDGDSVTEFSAVAKSQLTSWDTRFDDEYAAWARGAAPAP